MNLPNFHDGFFDGFLIGPDKRVNIFLRTVDKQPYILTLKGVDALSISEVKRGNIIFDVVIRRTDEITVSDIQGLYGPDLDSQMASKLLRAKVDQKLQILEINPSYGAQALVAFESFGIKEQSYVDHYV